MKLDQLALEFMAKRAERFGKVFRSEVVAAVGISTVHASSLTKDPELLERNGLYRMGKGLMSHRVPSSEDFFADLDEASRLPLMERPRRLGGEMPVWVSPGLRDHARGEVLPVICQAIERHESVLFEYVGMGAGEKRQFRRGEPIGFANIGGRWHVRVWMYLSPTGKEEGWRDLVLGRIVQVEQPLAIDPTRPRRNWMHRLRLAEEKARQGDDSALEAWLQEAELMPETRFLEPHPSLTDDQKEVVRVEFGLDKAGGKTLLAHEWVYMEKQYIATASDQRPPQYLLVYQKPSA